LARSGLRRERTGEYRNGRNGRIGSVRLGKTRHVQGLAGSEWSGWERLGTAEQWNGSNGSSGSNGSNGLEWTVEALRGEMRNGRSGLRRERTGVEMRGKAGANRFGIDLKRVARNGRNG